MKTLQVGKRYSDGNGDWYIITENEDSTRDEYPFRGTNLTTGYSYSYAPQGQYIKEQSGMDDLLLPFETEQQKEPTVKHLEVILAIIQGTPVQYDYTLSGTWHDYGTEDSTELNPVKYSEYNWRIKPPVVPKRTVQIGKRTVVAPEVEAPVRGCGYYIPFGTLMYTWEDDLIDNNLLESARVFLDKEHARDAQEAIRALLLGKD
jgi:hypothetical protein